MASNLTSQVRNIAAVTTAVANGDLSKKITVDVKGEILELKNTINTMVDQLSSFADEVTRVAREVGTEGKLGGQADVRGVSGTWKDLTDNVNFMAGNLTNQVRGIAKVVTAVANGDLKQKLLVEAKGEIAELADTINSMIETLATFADQVTTVAREVGVEGKLGGQANVPGAAGTWKDLTDNVNQLAANLTTQVRAIADVATAVTKGDLTRFIQVEARRRSGGVEGQHQRDDPQPERHDDQEQRAGLAEDEPREVHAHVAGPKGNAHGRQTDSVRTGARSSARSTACSTSCSRHAKTRPMRSSAKRISSCCRATLTAIAKTSRTSSRWAKDWSDRPRWRRNASCLPTRRPDYVQITSGLGAAPPTNIIVLPVLFEGQVKAVMELSSFEQFTPTHQAFLDQLVESIGIVLNTIEANTRTEDLLKQSQSLAKELQSRQEELQNTNNELQEKAQTAGRAERGSGTQEQRSRTGPPGARRKSQAARAHFEIQIRVPREHVARIAHAAQFAAHSRRSVGAEPRRQPRPEASRVREDDSCLRQRFAHAHQRHSRPVEDRIGHGHGRCRGSALQRTARLRGSHVPPRRRGEGARLPNRDRSGLAAQHVHGQPASRAGHPQSAVERVQVHGARAASRSVSRRSRKAGARIAIRSITRVRWWRFRSATRASAFRRRNSRSSSRRFNRRTVRRAAQIRRHGAGPGDQPRNCALARRRNPAGQRGRAGKHVHIVSAAELHSGARGPQGKGPGPGPARHAARRSPAP